MTIIPLQRWNYVAGIGCSELEYCICYSANVEIAVAAVVGWQIVLEPFVGNSVEIVRNSDDLGHSAILSLGCPR